jgi:enoyl-CoA hydratase/carnithine racemase
MTQQNSHEANLMSADDFQTIRFEVDEHHVATITLARPDKLNAANARMLAEFKAAWRLVRDDDGIHVVVLRADGDRAFSTGLDRVEGFTYPDNVWNKPDPGTSLSPKHHKVWKPVICAIQGMCAGGAFYWVYDADIVIASQDATFFDPHVDFGLTAALEPIGLLSRMPLGEVLRMFLLGLEERMTADTALRIGLVSEVVPNDQLWTRANVLARRIAAKPPVAIQGTVRAIWESLDLGRTAALERGLYYTQIGNPIGIAAAENFMKSGRRLPFERR